jgi:hypothetical protein
MLQLCMVVVFNVTGLCSSARLQAGLPSFDSLQEQGFFFFSTASRLALRLTQSEAVT